MPDKKKNRGGKRPGSGQPKKEPTKVIGFRVPLAQADVLTTIIKPIIKKHLEQ